MNDLFFISCDFITEMKQWCAIIVRDNTGCELQSASAEEIFLENVNALARSFTVHSLLLTALSVCASVLRPRCPLDGAAGQH